MARIIKYSLLEPEDINPNKCVVLLGPLTPTSDTEIVGKEENNNTNERQSPIILVLVVCLSGTVLILLIIIGLCVVRGSNGYRGIAKLEAAKNVPSIVQGKFHIHLKVA